MDRQQQGSEGKVGNKECSSGSPVQESGEDKMEGCLKGVRQMFLPRTRYPLTSRWLDGYVKETAAQQNWYAISRSYFINVCCYLRV